MTVSFKHLMTVQRKITIYKSLFGHRPVVPWFRYNIPTTSIIKLVKNCKLDGYELVYELLRFNSTRKTQT